MRIESIETRLVDVPLANPIGTAIHSMRSIGCVLVAARSADGVVGQGYALALNSARIGSLDEMIKGLAENVIGRAATETEGIWADLWLAINAMGHKGVTVSAMSAIDMALWDVVGRTLDMPLHRLWGSCRDSIPTYASSGLWLSMSIDELVAEAAAFVDQGFHAMKMRVGNAKVAGDVARVAAVREAIGDDIELLVDANQSLDAKHAIQLGRALEPHRIGWLEEPVPAYDLAGHRRVRDALDTVVASGETEYTRFGMAAMIEAGAADVLMPDLQRIGGFTEFRRAASLASSFNIPVSTHLFTEHSLCLAGSIPGCISVEHFDWLHPLFDETPELVNGELVIPTRPGHGFIFGQDAVERLAIT